MARKSIKKKKHSIQILCINDRSDTQTVTEKASSGDDSALNTESDTISNTVEEGSSGSETTGNGFKNNIPIKVINRVRNYEGKKRLLKKILNHKMDPYYDSDPLQSNFAKWRTLKMKKALIDSAIDRLENSTII